MVRVAKAGHVGTADGLGVLPSLLACLVSGIGALSVPRSSETRNSPTPVTLTIGFPLHDSGKTLFTESIQATRLLSFEGLSLLESRRAGTAAAGRELDGVAGRPDVDDFKLARMPFSMTEARSILRPSKRRLQRSLASIRQRIQYPGLVDIVVD